MTLLFQRGRWRRDGELREAEEDLVTTHCSCIRLLQPSHLHRLAAEDEHSHAGWRQTAERRRRRRHAGTADQKQHTV